MSVILTGVAECVAGMAKMAKRQHAATGVGLARAAHLLERNIKADLSVTTHALGEPTGSAPGDAPALVSGDLRRSIQVEGPTTVAGTQWAASVGPTVVYGRIQELGGDTGRAVLPARPYVGPALERIKPDMQEIMKAAWRAGQAL